MPDKNPADTIPRIGFGTYLIPDEDATALVHAALKIGYRHIDTAEGYHNEEGVGGAVSRAKSELGLERKDIFITTKMWPGNPERGIPVKDYDEAIKALDTSLQKLGTDYVDLYLIHAPLGGNKRIEQWRAFCDLKKAGKAKAIGVSNYGKRHIEEINSAGLPSPDANQLELHPWSQKPELVAYLKKHGIVAIAYSSLLPLANWRPEPENNGAKTDAMKREAESEHSPFKRMAGKYGVTEAQLLLKWGLNKGFAILPKSVNERRMKENFDLETFKIDQQDMAALDRLDRGDGIAWKTGDPTKTD